MRVETPTIIVIFGATGDLARRKLFNALFSLFKRGMLPKKFKIIGFSRSELTDEEFRKFISKSRVDASEFLNKAVYQDGLFEDLDAYKKLGETLLKIDKEFGTCSNKLFHLAVAPKYYKTILENLSYSGLTIPCSDSEGWTRVLVEKPFGDNIKTAKELDALLSRLFREEQIFRIDHYIARETMQNILTFRFSNRIFEPLWNNQYIEKVDIKLYEKGGLGDRGDFYDDIGALRDVGQNHLLQMLAVIAMGHPQKFDTIPIRRERAKIQESLRPIKEREVPEYTSRGQYDTYKKLRGAKKNSKTETYFKIEAFIDNARWRGVPFYLESGKELSENRVGIDVYFKSVSPCFCPAPHEEHTHQNMLSFNVKPKEGISIRFWAKKPGLTSDVEARNLKFEYRDEAASMNKEKGGSEYFHETATEAYERIIFDCIRGDQTLFASTEEVMAAWRFVTPILNSWEKNKPPLKIYKKGEAFSQ